MIMITIIIARRTAQITPTTGTAIDRPEPLPTFNTLSNYHNE